MMKAMILYFMSDSQSIGKSHFVNLHFFLHDINDWVFPLLPEMWQRHRMQIL